MNFPPKIRLDDLVVDYVSRYAIPGCGVAVVRNGVLLHAAGYGFANLESRTPVTSDTVYELASVAKQFTAMLVLLLAERGLLHVEEKIASHFPSPPDAWARITIRHLLTHTSGISDVGWGNLNLRLDYTDGDLVRAIASAPLEFAPGSRWGYSNSGYILLGILIAGITGRFYGDLLDEWIFKPLGMTTARVNSEEAIVANRAAGYRLDCGQIKNQEYVSPTLNRTADGGLCATVLDMAKWERALHTDALLPQTSRDEMWTPVTLSDGSTYGYGFGWSIGSSPYGGIVEHDGGWQGFATHIVRYIDNGLTVIVLANLADAPATDLAYDIATASLSSA